LAVGSEFRRRRKPVKSSIPWTPVSLRSSPMMLPPPQAQRQYGRFACTVGRLRRTRPPRRRQSDGASQEFTFGWPDRREDSLLLPPIHRQSKGLDQGRRNQVPNETRNRKRHSVFTEKKSTILETHSKKLASDRSERNISTRAVMSFTSFKTHNF